jgi:hypothetical protein
MFLCRRFAGVRVLVAWNRQQRDPASMNARFKAKKSRFASLMFHDSGVLVPENNGLKTLK